MSTVGVSKSAVSRETVEASERVLKELMERRLDAWDLALRTTAVWSERRYLDLTLNRRRSPEPGIEELRTMAGRVVWFTSDRKVRGHGLLRYRARGLGCGKKHALYGV